MTDDVIEKVANIINETLDAHIAAHQLAAEGLLANTPRQEDEDD